jgi:hypothetical protein
MYNTKSSYVRERIRQTRFEDRDEIEPLLSIERYAHVGRITGYAHSMLVHRLWSGHNSAFHAILTELNPALLEQWKRKEEEQEKAARESEESARREEEDERKAWIKAGGLI